MGYTHIHCPRWLISIFHLAIDETFWCVCAFTDCELAEERRPLLAVMWAGVLLGTQRGKGESHQATAFFLCSLVCHEVNRILLLLPTASLITRMFQPQWVILSKVEPKYVLPP